MDAAGIDADNPPRERNGENDMTATSVIRLCISDELGNAETLKLGRDQSHYLVNVMRITAGTAILLFNGRDGEWQGTITKADKRAVMISLAEQTRPQISEPDVWLCFAPLKKDRTDFVIEKATELGVAHIQPVITERTQTTRVNVDRLNATAREAAEQSERLSIPNVAQPIMLSELLANWPSDRPLIHLDETGSGAPLAEVMMRQSDGIGFLIGPEGGFAPSEISTLTNHPSTLTADLGPRILRAETACVAALGVRQSIDDLPPKTP